MTPYANRVCIFLGDEALFNGRLCPVPQNRNRLDFTLFGLLKSSAEGPLGITGLILMVIIVLGVLAVLGW